MEAAANADKPSSSFLERLGMYPPLGWGFVAVFFMMCGCGIESGFLSAYLHDQGISQSAVALVFTVYGITATFAAWLAGALSDLWGPKRVMAAGVLIWVVFHAAFLLLGIAPGNYALILISYALRICHVQPSDLASRYSFGPLDTYRAVCHSRPLTCEIRSR